MPVRDLESAARARVIPSSSIIREGLLSRVFSPDGGIVAFGVAAAIASGSFASYMMTQDRSGSQVSGAQYLHLFSQPRDAAPTRLAGRFSGDLDTMVTGSIPQSETTNRRATSPQAYVLRDVMDGTAWIEGPDGTRKVVPGTVLPGAGRVTAIEQRGGQWTLVTTAGLIVAAR